MKRFLLLFLSISMASSLMAQETTYGGRKMDNISGKPSKGSFVIVPFEDRMYLSDVDAPIGRSTGLQPGELRGKFRNALVSTLEQELTKFYNIKKLYDPTTNSQGMSLEYVHQSLKYDFQYVSDEVLMANDSTLDKKNLKKASKRSKEQEGIVNGQVVSRSDTRERYMNMRIENDSLMHYLNTQVGSDFYLFINEFDIRYHVTNPDQISNGGLSYQLKVHFTCTDASGKELKSGMTTYNVVAKTQNIYEIIAEGIPVVSKKLAKMINSFGFEAG